MSETWYYLTIHCINCDGIGSILLIILSHSPYPSAESLGLLGKFVLESPQTFQLALKVPIRCNTYNAPLKKS